MRMERTSTTFSRPRKAAAIGLVRKNLDARDCGDEGLAICTLLMAKALTCLPMIVLRSSLVVAGSGYIWACEYPPAWSKSTYWWTTTKVVSTSTTSCAASSGKAATALVALTLSFKTQDSRQLKDGPGGTTSYLHRRSGAG